MTVSKAQQKSVNKYVKENYDRINVTFPKGKREILKSYADAQNISVNAFILSAVENALNGTSNTGECTISPQSYAVAAEHVKGTGESISDFIGRAISDTVARDKVIQKMKQK